MMSALIFGVFFVGRQNPGTLLLQQVAKAVQCRDLCSLQLRRIEVRAPLSQTFPTQHPFPGYCKQFRDSTLCVTVENKEFVQMALCFSFCDAGHLMKRSGNHESVQFWLLEKEGSCAKGLEGRGEGTASVLSIPIKIACSQNCVAQ